MPPSPKRKRAGNAEDGGLAFAGWVPTITGHLSFSLIGLSGAPSGAVCANAICRESAAQGKPRRHVAVSQKRVTTDLPYNGWPVGWFKPSTKAEYILLGETEPADTPSLSNGEIKGIHDDIGLLRGRILIVPHHKAPATRRLAGDLIQALRRLISDFGARAPRGSASDIAALFPEADDLIRRASKCGVVVIEGHFELYRSGEFRLRMRNPLAVATEDGHSDSALRTLSAQQMYYFVKDISHRHYHHRPRSDNLLPLVSTSNGDDTAWRRDSLWSLVRAILESRRRNNLQGYKSALGILSYAEAFQTLLARIYRNPILKPEFLIWSDATLYDFRHTRASLEATISEREFVETASASFKSVFIATVLAAAALWIATIQISEAICSALGPAQRCVAPPAWMANVLKHLIQHPSTGFWVVFGAGVLWYGGRLRFHPLTAWLAETLDSWTQALGASFARQFRPRLLGYSDVVGTISAAATVLLLGSLLIVLIGGLFQLW